MQIKALFPLIAILRGLTAERAAQLAQCLFKRGFQLLEVPLNSQEAYASIGQLAAANSQGQGLIGAGTVTEVAQLSKIKAAGGEFIVTPHTDSELIKTAKHQQLQVIAGCYSASEAIAAIQAGADALKWFPAGCSSSAYLASIMAILPKQLPVYAVGGITLANMRDYYQAGADGFGLGSSLFTPALSLAQIAENAEAFAAHMKTLIKYED